MSLLQIVQDALDALNLPATATVIGNREKNVRQIFQAILDSGEALCQMKNSRGDGWAILERAYEFETVVGVPEYDLPPDFKRMTTDTAWQRDVYWRMRGSLSGRAWQNQRAKTVNTIYNTFRITRSQSPLPGAQRTVLNAPVNLKKFALEPAPGDKLPIVFEYISDAWWVSADGTTFKDRPDRDDDESLFGNQIHKLDAKWRWQSDNGMDFATALAVFEDFRDQAFGQDVPKQAIPIGGRYLRGNPDYSDVEWSDYSGF